MASILLRNGSCSFQVVNPAQSILAPEEHHQPPPQLDILPVEINTFECISSVHEAEPNFHLSEGSSQSVIPQEEVSDRDLCFAT